MCGNILFHIRYPCQQVEYEKHTSGSGQYHIIGAAQGGHKHNKRDQPQPCHIEAEGSEKYMGCHAVIPEIHIIGIGNPERDPVTHSPEKKGGKGFGQDRDYEIFSVNSKMKM